MSPDLRLATVAVMPLGGKEDRGRRALNGHKKELRALVAHRINLKFAPELRFALDSSFDAQGRIDALLKSPQVARDLAPRRLTTRTSHERRRRGRRRRRDGSPQAATGARRSVRRASKSTAGSISTSRSASPRPRRSAGSNFCSTPGRPATPARSIRWPRACCRSPSARRRRQCRSSRTAPRPTAFACAGARKPTPTTPKARSSRRSEQAPDARARSRPHCRASSAWSAKSRRHFRRSRSTANAPTISPAAARVSRSRPRPISVYRLAVVSAEVNRRCSRPNAAKGAYMRAIARDLGRRARLLRTCGRAQAHPRRSFRRGSAVPLDRLPDEAESTARALSPLQAGLAEFPRSQVDRNGAARLRRGQKLLLRGAARRGDPLGPRVSERRSRFGAIEERLLRVGARVQ